MTAIQVDPAALTRSAKTVCQIADDLRLARSAWSAVVVAPAFGVSVPVAALHEVWSAELGVYSEVLEQWCTAASAAAAGYKSIDAFLAAQVRP